MWFESAHREKWKLCCCFLYHNSNTYSFTCLCGYTSARKWSSCTSLNINCTSSSYTTCGLVTLTSLFAFLCLRVWCHVQASWDAGTVRPRSPGRTGSVHQNQPGPQDSDGSHAFRIDRQAGGCIFLLNSNFYNFYVHLLSASSRDVLHIGDYIVLVSASKQTPLAYWVVQWSWSVRVNALCNLSRKKSREVTASLPGQFLSRRCLTLSITMEVEPRIAKQYKCHHCCSCKYYQGKGM